MTTGEIDLARRVVAAIRAVHDDIRPHDVRSRVVVNVDLVGGGVEVVPQPGVPQRRAPVRGQVTHRVQPRVLEHQCQSIGRIRPLGLVDETGGEVAADVHRGPMPGGGDLVSDPRRGNREQPVADQLRNRLLEQWQTGQHTDLLDGSQGTIPTGEAERRGRPQQGGQPDVGVNLLVGGDLPH